MPEESKSDRRIGQGTASLSYMALHHYRNGRLQQAKNLCQRILQSEQHADAILMLGKIAHEQKDLHEAADYYQQFLQLQPDHAQTQLHLGTLFMGLDQTELAIEHLQKSVSLVNDNAAAHARLGDAYTKLARWGEAQKAYQDALALQPDDLTTTIKLGNVFLATQSFAQAVQLYERTLAASPDNAQLLSHLGASLHKLGRSQRAIGCFEQALRLRPDYARARNDFALVLRQLERTTEALEHLQRAIHLRPQDADAHISLALTLRQVGQTDLAVDQLEEFLVKRPRFGAAYYHISLMKPKSDLIPVLERVTSSPGLANSDAIHCHFALGNLLNAEGSVHRAFAHYQKANSLKRQSFAYDPENNTSLFDRLIRSYSKEYFESKRDFGCASQVPVFVVGLPRSGTTLVEQILSSHGLVHGAGEIETFSGVNHSIAQQLKHLGPAPESMSHIDAKMVEEFSSLYLQELRFRSPSAERIVDKLPGNFVRIGLIKTLFPHARIVHCRRKPLDNCVSLFFHYFQALSCSFDLTELGRYYLDYQRLVAHWQDLFPGEIFEVQYEDLVADPERVTRNLIDYLDLAWDQRCLEFYENKRTVMSPSNIQVRQPIFTTSIDRWKPYKEHLEPLIEVLQPAPH